MQHIQKQAAHDQAHAAARHLGSQVAQGAPYPGISLNSPKYLQGGNLLNAAGSVSNQHHMAQGYSH